MMGRVIDYWKEFVKEKNPWAQKDPEIDGNGHVKISSESSYSEVYGHKSSTFSDDPSYLNVSVEIEESQGNLTVKYVKRTKEGPAAIREKDWKSICDDFAKKTGFSVHEYGCEGICAAIFTPNIV